MKQNLLRLNRDSRMVRAGIGNAVVKDKTQKVRGDKTCWIEGGSKNAAEMEFLDLVKQFMSYLNQTCYTGVNSCEFHYALYEEGTSYTRHRDQLKNDYNRKYSMISYLNDDWQAADGGQLIIHRDETTTEEILPLNQRAVFFQSDVLEHEVVTATRPRMSITGWLKRV
ncbi:MAG: 2OG-Fe(II) oxygenase [Bacteroidota bacterium]